MAQTVLAQPDPVDQHPFQIRLARYREGIKSGLSELYKSKTACVGAIMLIVLAIACLATPYIDRYSPVKQNYCNLLQPPSAAHYFGTDRYGRDIWSRVLWGGRRLMSISLLASWFRTRPRGRLWGSDGLLRWLARCDRDADRGRLAGRARSPPVSSHCHHCSGVEAGRHVERYGADFCSRYRLCSPDRTLG